MATIGAINDLEIIKEVPFGVYLDGGAHGEILLPARYVPAGSAPGSRVNVFIYPDSEDRLVATTEKPLAMVGDFAMLRVVDVTPLGAFLDWGLPKDLLAPFREQKERMEKGKEYLVFVYLDDISQRIVATARLDKCLGNVPVDYEPGEEVDILIAARTELGYKAIVDNSHWGMLYHSDIFRPLSIGQRLKGYIKNVRADEKIDLRLDKPGHEKIETLATHILQQLKDAGGFMPIGDSTSPEEIRHLFNASKKSFKQAIGSLYKSRLITIDDAGIRSV
ncbi:MAG: GntR family transcriptional regulator [Bacteroidales bacterium]|jgi:predicted RNA-binding protein (virulence factor B family)|nr:GntR family transcriptional regulator [Bacteroidales bacterium]